MKKIRKREAGWRKEKEVDHGKEERERRTWWRRGEGGRERKKITGNRSGKEEAGEKKHEDGEPRERKSKRWEMKKDVKKAKRDKNGED